VRRIPCRCRYNSVLLQQFINKVMQRGKKTMAEKIVYQSIELAAERLKKTPMEVFEMAIRNAGPAIEVKPSVWAVRPTRCRSRSRATAARRWRCAGC